MNVILTGGRGYVLPGESIPAWRRVLRIILLCIGWLAAWAMATVVPMMIIYSAASQDGGFYP